MKIRHIPTPKGTKSLLTYWYKGIRSRYVLGYNLTEQEEQEEAAQAMKDARAMQEEKPRGKEPTLKEFVPVYLKEMEQKRRDTVRNRRILETYIIPMYGHKRLSSLSREDGLGYMIYRRKMKAKDGTIQREMHVFNALLNLAVDYEHILVNKFNRLQVPKYDPRTRTVTDEELARLYAKASLPLQRAMTLALHTGLRLGVLSQIDPSWLRKESDGFWLTLPKAKTCSKQNAPKIPLNRTAVHALYQGVAYLPGRRIFDRWADGNGLSHAFQRLCKRLEIKDLHFHDLRHTFATRLQDLGVDYEVRAALLGHSINHTTTLYSHGGYQRMRAAVTLLEVPLSGATQVSDRQG